MADEDITKGKKKGKKRRRSARVYVNANRPLAVSLDDIAAHFPSDDDDDPGSQEKAMFNHPDSHTGADHNAARVSAPLTGGHASPSSGDHGVGQGRSSFIAAHHPDLKQSNTSFDQVLARLRTVNGDNQNGDRDITYRPGEVALRMFDAAGQAGHYHDMQAVNPSPQRPDWHQARNSATAPNGGHSQAAPTSRPPMAAKSNSELRADMKRLLFPGGGR